MSRERRRAGPRCSRWMWNGHRRDPYARTAYALVLTLLGAACSDGGMAPVDDPIAQLRADALAAGLAALPSEPMRPIDNPYLPARVELGHNLFFDPILSGPQDVACSTCHLPRFAFADGRQFPSGAGGVGLGPDRTDPSPSPLRLMPRNSPPVFNIGHYGRFGPTPTVNGMIFWSGSAFGIEDQILLPITADNELRGLTYPKFVAIDSVTARLRSIPGYVARFAEAFPEIAGTAGADATRLITPQTLRLAVAAYIRELNTPDSPFDRFMRGQDDALGADARDGLSLFIGKANCVACHTGPVLSDFSMHVIGARQMGLGRDTTPGDDIGWGEHGGTAWAFRTAPLRHVAESSPYLHAGTAETLADVIRFKNNGRSEHNRVPDSRLDAAMRPLGLTEAEMGRLVAFLESLSDAGALKGLLFQPPASVPSGLEIPQ